MAPLVHVGRTSWFITLITEDSIRIDFGRGLRVPFST